LDIPLFWLNKNYRAYVSYWRIPALTLVAGRPETDLAPLDAEVRLGGKETFAKSFRWRVCFNRECVSAPLSNCQSERYLDSLAAHLKRVEF
jgi:hypothetical protein